MAQNAWIELRSVGGRFPTLLEHRRAYSLFDGHFLPPRLLVAIGGRSKRLYLSSNDNCSGPNGHSIITIGEWSANTVVFDCELHNLESLEAIKAGHSDGSHVHHPLHAFVPRGCSARELSQLAYDFYWQVLIPFSSTILLFFEDLGGLGPVIEVIARWIRQSAINPTLSPPRVLVLYDCKNRVQAEKFTTRLRARSVAFIGGRESEVTKTDTGVVLESTHAFECLKLVSTIAATSDFIQTNIDESFSFRERAGYALNSEHTKVLLQAALSQFCLGSSQQIDLHLASRAPNPVSSELEYHLNCFIDATKSFGLDQSDIIASALDLDAHPPGMHRFPAGSTLDKFYLNVLGSIESRWQLPGFASRVRNKFITYASERREGSSDRAHGRVLSEHKDMWQDLHSVSTCLSCLMRSPAHTLQCKHRLCTACAIIYGTTETSDQCKVLVSKCPLCQGRNTDLLPIRPPTAGVRVLELAGPASTKEGMFSFLKQLQFTIGLPLSLREHFDMVIGLDIGSFFVQTIFLEGWTLGDCRYHLKNIIEPKIDKRKGTASFGKSLQWDIKDITLYNGPRVTLQIKGQRVSNMSSREEEKLSPFTALTKPADPVVRYFGGVETLEDRTTTANQLISCLFYIELLSNPTFYSTSETARLRLLCRLPPSPPLVSLIKGLHMRNAGLFYRGSDIKFTEEPLVVASCLSKCINGKPFLKLLNVPVRSLSCKIDVRVEGIAGSMECISNCPYELRSIIKDQGLNCFFGRNDHKTQVKDGLETLGDNLTEEIGRLRDTLDNVISLYSKF